MSTQVAQSRLQECLSFLSEADYHRIMLLYKVRGCTCYPTPAACVLCISYPCVCVGVCDGDGVCGVCGMVYVCVVMVCVVMVCM